MVSWQEQNLPETLSGRSGFYRSSTHPAVLAGRWEYAAGRARGLMRFCLLMGTALARVVGG